MAFRGARSDGLWRTPTATISGAHVPSCSERRHSMSAPEIFTRPPSLSPATSVPASISFHPGRRKMAPCDEICRIPSKSLRAVSRMTPSTTGGRASCA